MVHRDDADRGSAQPCSLLSTVTSPGPTAGSRPPQAERAIGLRDRGRMVARRHEHEEHVRLLVLDALEERREVRHRSAAAHRDVVDHLAAGRLEGALERIAAVLAGREVAVPDGGRLGTSCLAAASPSASPACHMLKEMCA